MSWSNILPPAWGALLVNRMRPRLTALGIITRAGPGSPMRDVGEGSGARRAGRQQADHDGEREDRHGDDRACEEVDCCAGCPGELSIELVLGHQ